MKRIKVLPQLLIDKIAAGEVIERPASVAKELVENAIDAGATQIKVEIEEGGKKLIRVIDNGSGIASDDLSLVFASHATNKIDNDTDLYRINTLGFRGEALASIVAVSQAQIISRPDTQPEAWSVTSQSGQASKPQPCAGAQGTSVEIRNLFFNTPARAKFLKSTPVELSHLTDVVTRYALAYPEIRFDLTHNREIITSLPPTENLAERIAYFFGSDVSQSLIKAEYNHDKTKLVVYISNPAYTKPNTRSQFFYLNRRYIRDRVIFRSVARAYADFIPAQRFPIIFLFITMAPEEFDVNVHPTKIEVRFRNAWAIHDLIIKTIRQSLMDHPDVPQPPSTTSNIGVPSGSGLPEDSRVLQAMVDFFAGQTKPQSASIPFSVPTSRHEGVGIGTPGLPKEAPPGQSVPQPVFQTDRRFFQLHNTYIVEEVPEGVLIIDQHALHERILYNRFKCDFQATQIYRQQLLIPVVIELEPGQMALLGEAREYLTRLGFEIEEFGRNTISVRTVPALVSHANVTELVQEALSSMGTPGEGQPDKIMDKLISLMACKAAVKAGDRLKEEEITSLLKQREEADYSLTCPHGRPAVFKLTINQLEKYFQRR